MVYGVCQGSSSEFFLKLKLCRSTLSRGDGDNQVDCGSDVIDEMRSADSSSMTIVGLVQENCG